jgi:hypothetical protein
VTDGCRESPDSSKRTSCEQGSSWSLAEGSHRGFYHPDAPGVSVILAGQLGDDARPYQERDVRAAISAVNDRQTSSESDRR